MLWNYSWPCCMRVFSTVRGMLLCCAAQHNVAMMIVVAGALLNDKGQVLVSQRKPSQSFPGMTCPITFLPLLAN